MYKIILSTKLKKFLLKYPDISRKFYDSLKQFSESCCPSELDIKKLKGRKNDFRFRIGKYRLIYKVDWNKKMLYFYDVDSRGDIYKQ